MGPDVSKHSTNNPQANHADTMNAMTKLIRRPLMLKTGSGSMDDLLISSRKPSETLSLSTDIVVDVVGHTARPTESLEPATRATPSVRPRDREEPLTLAQRMGFNTIDVEADLRRHAKQQGIPLHKMEVVPSLSLWQFLTGAHLKPGQF